MESQLETEDRKKACSGDVFAALMAMEVRWVFRHEGCASLLERRAELKR